jgi:virginiamycin B lyase
MPYYPSDFGDRRRQVAAFFVSIGLAVSSLIVPWVASNADASTPVVTNFTGTGISSPEGITAGPDGALWFTNEMNNTIGRVTTGGAVTNYTGAGSPVGIAAGPDGALWFTNFGNKGGTGSIGRITTAGAVTDYTGTGVNAPVGIAAGPDGALWFTNFGNNSIGRITTGGVVTNFTGTGISGPGGITAGPDGALWFTNLGNNSIGRITTGGVVTNFTGTGIDDSEWIAAGSDGALWFTNLGNSTIGRITTGGVVTNYTGTGISGPSGIAAGPDGALWFTNQNNNSIGRITTGGVVTNFTGTGISSPEGITAGPDGALWLTNDGNNSIGRITTGSNPPPTTSVGIPSNGATLSGTAATLDASASNATSVELRLFGGIYGYAAPVICTATPTIYGWLCSWNTTSVPNGSYELLSEAFGPGGSAFSSGVSVTVDNTPPSTSMLIPSSGATLFGPAILDAAASDNVGVTKVEFHLTGGTLNDAPIATATPTLFGWIADWNSKTVPNGTYTLQSVAYDAEGFSTHSTGITVSVLNGPIVYVTEIGGGSNGPSNVTPIDTENNTPGRPITSIGDTPLAIAITPDGTTAYVSNATEPGAMTPINLVTGFAETPITIAANAYSGAIAITPNGSTAYVGEETTDAVIPINLATKTIGTPIPTCTTPHDTPADIVISPDGTTAYVACPLSGTVVPINTSTNTAGSPISAGEGPEGLAITPNGATLYVANFGAFAVVNGQVMQISDGTTVTPIDTATGTAGTPITVDSEPSSVAITPDGTTAYVVNLASNNVTPIDIATSSAGSPITLNATLTGTGNQIAITPDGATAYVVTRNNTLIPIDTANNTTETPISVGPFGPEPSAIAIH